MAARSPQPKDSAMFIATANALAGAAGGIIAMTIVFPLDVCLSISNIHFLYVHKHS